VAKKNRKATSAYKNRVNRHVIFLFATG